MEPSNVEYVDINEEIEEMDENEEYEDEIMEVNFKEENKIPARMNNKKGVKIHSISSKLKIIKYAEAHGRVEAQEKYSVPESTLRDWLKNKEKFENLDSTKLSLSTLHKGPSPKYSETNNKLIDYIEFNRKLGLPITTWALLLELYKLEPEKKDLSINANLQLLYRFMKRFGYSFRCGTYIGQSINEDALKNASLFWNEVHNIIKENGFGKYNIFNMDECSIFFNMVPNKTIAKRGKKQY